MYIVKYTDWRVANLLRTGFQARYRRFARKPGQVHRFQGDGGRGRRLYDRRAERARASGL